MKSRGSKFLVDDHRRHCECASCQFPKSVKHMHKCDVMKGSLLTRICLSSAPVARYLPSGLKHTLRMYRSPAFPAVSSARTLRIMQDDYPSIGKWKCNYAPCLCPCFGIVDLCCAIASGCKEFPVCGESNTAHYTVIRN